MLAITPPASPRASVGPHRDTDAALERRVQVAIEEVGRLHDVHVGVDEAQSFFHGDLHSRSGR
jgi:hypothetical protein